jgi:hypothetical protein
MIQKCLLAVLVLSNQPIQGTLGLSASMALEIFLLAPLMAKPLDGFDYRSLQIGTPNPSDDQDFITLESRELVLGGLLQCIARRFI